MSFRDLEFRSFPYIPALRSRDSECSAFGSLPDDYQERLLPLVTLFRSGNGTDFSTPLNKALKLAAGRPFILDIDRIQTRASRTADPDVIAAAGAFNATLNSLADPANGFFAWRTFTAAVPNAIPCVIIGGPINEFLAQVSSLLNEKGKIAIRTSGADDELQLVARALQTISNLADVLVIIDLGDVHGRVARASQAFDQARSKLVAALPGKWFDLRLVCLGTSFPIETPVAGPSRLRIEEADVFDAIGGYATAQYGDYAGMPVRPQKGGGLGFPRVVGPMDREWIQARGQNVGAILEYVTCAQQVKAGGWASIPGLWGSDRIDAAAAGNIVNMGNAAKWLAVKMNIHLYRQLDRVSALVNSPDADMEEDDLMEPVES